MGVSVIGDTLLRQTSTCELSQNRMGRPCITLSLTVVSNLEEEMRR